MLTVPKSGANERSTNGEYPCSGRMGASYKKGTVDGAPRRRIKTRAISGPLLGLAYMGRMKRRDHLQGRGSLAIADFVS